MALVLFIAGIVLLVGGAELLVRGASRLAAAAGISPLVIGLTVVACGTGAPELAVSLQAALTGGADIALGNIVGSNTANVLLVLGLSASIAPLVVTQQLVRTEVPILILVSALLVIVSLDGAVDRHEGVLFVTLGVLYTAFTVWQGRRTVEQAKEHSPHERVSLRPTGQTLRHLSLVVAGLVLLVLGARWLVEGAVTFARVLGLSELIIGLTVVAVGTSLPEIATSLLAAARGERDIAVGNAIGSNIFNILAVLGVTSAVAPAGIGVPPAALAFDLPVMLVVAVACLPVFFTGHRVDRWEGLLFVAYYAAYTLYLFLAAAEHDALPLLNTTMLLFALPLTIATLVVVMTRQVTDRARENRSNSNRG
jgi:cation:H+ antiporter